MKKVFLCLLIICLSTAAFSQVLRGKVFDNETKEPIPYANVYINNTLRGTSTNLDGEFSLDISELSGQGVVISCIGYESLVLSEIIQNKRYSIYIEPKATLLEEITISADADGMSRKAKLKIFQREFLGQTKNAKKCVIQNLDDLDFTYSNTSKTLTASSTTPLIIENKALGYLITYYLEDFKMIGDNVSYHGYAIFKENTRPIRSEIRKVNANREEAYLGSRMHFFRALWSDSLQASNFEVVESESQEVPEFEIQLADSINNIKSLTYEKTLTIRYNNGYRSYIYFEDDGKIFFKENGFFDPSNHSWRGNMALKRVGDLLPYEYEVEDK